MRWLVLVGVVVLLGSAAAALAATGVFKASPGVCRPHRSAAVGAGGRVPDSALSVSFRRRNGRLRSVSVTAAPDQVVNGCTEVEVWADSLSVIPGAAAPEIVDRQEVPLMRTKGLPAWVGTLRTKDWAGGCDRYYRVVAMSVTPGAPLAELVSDTAAEQLQIPTELDSTGWFDCRGSPPSADIHH
jgi:hypothetical protein